MQPLIPHPLKDISCLLLLILQDHMTNLRDILSPNRELTINQELTLNRECILNQQLRINQWEEMLECLVVSAFFVLTNLHKADDVLKNMFG